ncbi:MAG: glycosyltransferase family 4 protein [Tenuifilaceae bacterium]
MRIAVNTRFLLKNRLEGIGWFTYETLKRITQQHPEHEFFFLFDRSYDPEFIFSKNITPVVLSPQSRHPVLWYIWFEYSVRRFIENNSIDLFLSTDGYLSLKSNVKQLGVIHDINFHHFPQTLPLVARFYYNYYFPKFAKKATRIATVSSYSKYDISKNYNIDDSKIDVVYNGANELYSPLSESEIDETRKIYSSGTPYFVFVGAFNPRKNICRLLQAFDKFKEQVNSDLKLVLVGENMYGTSEMIDTLNKMKFKDEVVFTGRLQVEQLRKVVGASFALTYVSYYEGFGIPLLEAMKCDIPIIASNCTSIPEVTANAAYYIDPFDVDSIVAGMVRIFRDAELRNNLIQNARIQRDIFSWDKTAQLLYESVLKALS